MRSAKTVSESRAEMTQIVLPMYVNSAFRLFGGQLMQWIDVVAAVVARRHSGNKVTTAAVEQLDFQAPAALDDVVVLRGRITCVGRTSMEVCVDTYVESLSGERRQVNRALLTLVALDATGRPTEVPALQPETAEEQADYEAGQARREARRAAKQ